MLVEFVKRGATISAERKVETLKELKRRIRRAGLNRKMNQVRLHEHNSLRRREAIATVDGRFSVILPTVPI